MTDTPPVSETLTAFIASARAADLPQDVRHAAKRSLLNFFATALPGTHDVAVRKALDTLRPFAGAGAATLIGRAERTDALTAAFINAAAANVHDFDDTHLRTVIHPTAPVAPALLAFAEQQPVSGSDFLQALALGIEVTCRICNAVSPDHYA
ncbi:MAG: MmgE/PrpD family protein, partial [Rhodospirillaceae bacterium]|nr:MmgE/PrpD family protein [Rhodospirillaceae bacterium]